MENYDKFFENKKTYNEAITQYRKEDKAKLQILQQLKKKVWVDLQQELLEKFPDVPFWGTPIPSSLSYLSTISIVLEKRVWNIQPEFFQYLFGMGHAIEINTKNYKVDDGLKDVSLIFRRGRIQYMSSQKWNISLLKGMELSEFYAFYNQPEEFIERELKHYKDKEDNK
jgi:hypothetical protein